MKKQLTSSMKKEARAGRPAWSPDGQEIVYKRFEARYPSSTRAVVCRISVAGGEARTIGSPARFFGSLFYLADGRLAWSISESDSRTSLWSTRVEAIDQQGTASTLTTIEGAADRIVPSPAGDGFYFRRRASDLFGMKPDEIVFLSAPDGAERSILPVSSAGGATRPRFTVSPDSKILYVGQAGRLWKVMLPAGARLPIPMQARVKLQVESITPPPAAAVARNSAAPRWIMTPRLTPDGRTLIFGAAGFLWRQHIVSARDILRGDTWEPIPHSAPSSKKGASSCWRFPFSGSSRATGMKSAR